MDGLAVGEMIIVLLKIEKCTICSSSRNYK